MAHRKPPDRFARVVGQVAREGFSDLAVCLTNDEAIKLLAREHRAVVRKWRAMRKLYMNNTYYYPSELFEKFSRWLTARAK